MAKTVKKKMGNSTEKNVKVQKVKSSEKDVPKSLKPKKTDMAKKKTAKKTEGTSPANWWSQARQYLREVVYELRKVVWPSRKETIASTSVVLVIVILVGVFLGFADLILSRVMRWVIG